MEGNTMKRIIATAIGLLSLALVLAAADLSGAWNFVMETQGGQRQATPTFQLDGDKVTGKWDTADVKGTFIDGKLSLAFPMTSREGGMTGTLKITGRMEGDTLSGTWEFEGYNGTYKATKAK